MFSVKTKKQIPEVIVCLSADNPTEYDGLKLQNEKPDYCPYCGFPETSSVCGTCGKKIWESHER